MAAPLPAGGILAAATIIIALCLCGTTTVTCEFPMIMSLERGIPPLNNVTKLSELIVLDHARHRRLLQNSSNDSGLSLQGTYDPYKVGLYYTKVQLGSPPRDFYLHVDTGSDPLWVTCSSCSSCPNDTQLPMELSNFDPGKSSTSSAATCSSTICNSYYESPEAVCSKDNRCTYTFAYADESTTSGYYVTDIFHFNSPTSNASSSSPLILFGCSTEVSGSFVTNERGVDGILGLGQGDLSLISQLSSKGLAPKVLSHCLRGDENGGGTLVFGEIVNPNIVYTPLIHDYSGFHYKVDLMGMEVNGKKLSVDPSKFETTVVDSGTTMAYLPDGVYEAFLDAITASISEGSLDMSTNVSNGDQCFLLKKSVSEVFPNISFNFAGGASMVLQPKDYLVHLMTFNNGEEAWCMGIQNMPGSQGFSILGDVVLKDKIIVYDLAGQRIGWADYDCSKPFKVSAKLESSASSLAVSRDCPHKTRTLAFFVLLICLFFWHIELDI